MGRWSSINVMTRVDGTGAPQRIIAGTCVSLQRSKRCCRDSGLLHVDSALSLSAHVLTTLLQSVARTWGFRIDVMPTYGALLSLRRSK